MFNATKCYEWQMQCNPSNAISYFYGLIQHTKADTIFKVVNLILLHFNAVMLCQLHFWGDIFWSLIDLSKSWSNENCIALNNYFFKLQVFYSFSCKFFTLIALTSSLILNGFWYTMPSKLYIVLYWCFKKWLKSENSCEKKKRQSRDVSLEFDSSFPIQKPSGNFAPDKYFLYTRILQIRFATVGKQASVACTNGLHQPFWIDMIFLVLSHVSAPTLSHSLNSLLFSSSVQLCLVPSLLCIRCCFKFNAILWLPLTHVNALVNLQLQLVVCARIHYLPFHFVLLACIFAFAFTLRASVWVCVCVCIEFGIAPIKWTQLLLIVKQMTFIFACIY